jgi:tRNA (mo5U34)-methyltransferase
VTPARDRPAREVQREVDALRWYHTIDVVPGVVTPGWWDLRHALPLLPFPDLTGKRCLDIGTWDGFYAYEMERRGAAEVIALDLADLHDIDFPPEVKADATFDPMAPTEQPRSAGFHLLHDLLESKVEWRPGSIYDLADLDLGTFDFVMLGDLLLHLRDPVRALDAVRRVTGGHVLLVDEVLLVNELLTRKRPLFELRGVGQDFQWWVGNDAGLRQLLSVGGFEIERSSPRFLQRPGPHGKGMITGRLRPKRLAQQLVHRVLAKDGSPASHLHRAHLAHPRF